MTDNGRAPSGQAGRASHGAASSTASPPSGDHPSRKPDFRFHRDALSVDGVTVNREPGNTFLKFNYDLCNAINMTNMSIVLGKMAERGWLDCREAELFHMQAGSLLALLRTANNRAYAIAMETQRAETENTGSVARP